MAKCIACDKFSTSNAGKMAELGFGNCAKAIDKHHYKSATYQRECRAFSQVAADTERARLELMVKK